MDDRTRLRHLFEGLRGRLSAREREAAAFCYLQGLSRSEAAERMGISEARMRKLMDGRGPGRPGVAGKVGALAETIRGGGWCEEQGSLMRGLAYGMLDPDGERYRLALIHRSECPACRAYVVSLRGLAAALPPVLLPWGLGAGALLRTGAHGGAGAGAQASAGVGGAISAPGAVGVGGAAGAGGAAGGSWLLAGGSLGTKLAVGCVLALGVGAGCVALSESPLQRPAHRHERARVSRGGAVARASANTVLNEDRLAGALTGARSAGEGGRSKSTPVLSAAAKAAREFGPEHGSGSIGPGSASSPSSRLTAVAKQASVASAASTSRSSPAQAGAEAHSAEREFGIE